VSAPDPASAALRECSALFAQGQHAELCREGESLLARVLGDGARAQRCEMLRMLVLSHAELGVFDEAMRLAHQIVHEAALAKDAGLALMGACSVGACFDRIGNPWQSIHLLQAALAAHEAAAPWRPRVIAHINLCAYHGDTWYRLRSAGDEAERARLLEGAQRHAAQATQLLHAHAEPLLEVVARGNLAEALLLGGDAAAAAPLLHSSLEQARARSLHAYVWRMRCTLATLHLAQGDAAGARSEAESLLADMGARAPRPTEIRARDIAFQACQAVGDPAAALTHFVVFERLERERTLAELRAQAQLFVPRAEAERSRWQAELAQEEVAAQSRLVALAQQRAETDQLTGLANRAGLQSGFDRLGGGLWALAALDLDHFKQVNDHHGHAAGDAVLVGFAELLRQFTRSGDLLARVGGEEFVLVLPGATVEAAAEVCERLRAAVQARREWPPPLAAALEVTVSIGLVAHTGGALQASLARADAALYEAKRQGRNRLVLADTLAAPV
jgi:diguanylate cyclase